MGMFEKNSADPLRDGKKKHVVSESRGPIGHGETDAFARDHASAANEEKRGDGGEEGEAMRPSSVAAVSDRRKFRGGCRHGLHERECDGQRPPLQKKNDPQSLRLARTWRGRRRSGLVF